ncbi:peroxisome- protein [Scheffersomyces spartinae]|uniref:Peroxisome- protein n=1 Tax=Scheffersomyces spartinae TaxID=45513 RepID=A0A9P8AJ59_9ASCO|nr:peroxisome- protein [Scheffersomyces spartinae]KAG7194519.1 peroxisome- protein [Scheffersomyces spartinae]
MSTEGLDLGVNVASDPLKAPLSSTAKLTSSGKEAETGDIAPVVEDDQHSVTAELRAKFADDIHSKPITQPQTSPLLLSTPPTVSKSLVKSYPYLLVLNKILSILTWTNDDYWVNITILSLYLLFIMYFENIITWFGHLIIVGAVGVYVVLNNRVVEEASLHPTLDDVVQVLTTTCVKADILLSPITTLSLTANDIKRLLFTTVFLTPIYLIGTFLIIRPRNIVLITGLYVLSYYSMFSRVCRRVLWKLKIVRALCFYLTGLDFLQAKNSNLFSAALAKVQQLSGLSVGLNSGNGSIGSGGANPVRFTYVIYENQRRWLGVGWTLNLFSYERAPWTDEFLNESSSIEDFELPNIDDLPVDSPQRISGAKWRWVDKTWRLDLTNDGALQLPSNKRSKTTADPSTDEGYVFFDNTWKKPLTEDTFSKYTRRRRWIRTAELIFDPSSPTSIRQTGSGRLLSPGVSPTRRQRNSIDEEEEEHHGDHEEDHEEEQVSIVEERKEDDDESKHVHEEVATLLSQNSRTSTSFSSPNEEGIGSTSRKRKSLRFDEGPVLKSD